MGTYVVTRGMAFLGDAMAHSILPGVAIAFISGNTTQGGLLVGGLIAGIASALGIGFLTRGRRLAEDTAIGIVFAGMLALGIGIISKSNNYAVDLAHVLAGNILAVKSDHLLLMFASVGAVLLVVAALYKELLAVSFDPILAKTLRLPDETLRLVLLVLLAVTVVVCVQAVGVALVAAMLVTPAAAARFFVKRLHHMMILAAGIAALGGVGGMYLSWHLKFAPSAAIVLTLTAFFALTFLFAPGKGYIWSLLGYSAKTA
jgi:ABC-type Mn2+/Zn2+ transport system permease subunit